MQMDYNELKQLGIKNLSDFKDGTVFILLGCEILGSEKLDTCKDYVYIKIGDRLLNHTGWISINNYEGIEKDFAQKEDNEFDIPPLEYEILNIYIFDKKHSLGENEVKFCNLNFNDIYNKTTHLIPIWRNTFFEVSELELCDYFFHNFDIEIDIKKGEKE